MFIALKHIYDLFHVTLHKPFHSGGDGKDVPVPILVNGEVEYKVESIVGHWIGRGVRWYLVFLPGMTCLRHFGRVQANCLMLQSL